jgi:phenylacetate-CoA ligase
MGESGYLDRKVETASLSEIRRLQEAKLAKQLDYLFSRSLFYQEKLQAAGIRRKDYRRIRDLLRFPFTTKQELRESQTAHPPLGKHIACDVEDVIRVHSSTGTTGKPSFVGLTHRDARIRQGASQSDRQ